MCEHARREIMMTIMILIMIMIKIMIMIMVRGLALKRWPEMY